MGNPVQAGSNGVFALPLSSWLQRRGIHYAWVIAAIAFLTMLTSSAALSLPGAFLQPLAKEFGWTVADISAPLAVRFALFGLMGPFSAILMERYGMRNVIAFALLLVAIGTLAATQVTHLWQLFLFWGLVLGIGSGLTALVLAAMVANRWFVARRGLVVGMLTASTATGQLIFLPVAAWLIDHVGWRYAVMPISAMLVLLLILVVCFLKSRPSDVGLAPYGTGPQAPAPAAPAQPASALTLWTPFVVLRQAAANPTFWILFGTFYICGLSTNGLIQTHFISLCSDYGLSAVPAASVLAMMGAFDFVGTILSGWLSDRVDNRKLLFWYYGLRGLSLFWLPHSTFTLYGLSIFAMFYGLDWVATVPPTVRLSTSAFGALRAPMIFGWIFAAHQLGAATAASGAGFARSVAFSYTPALYVAGAACLLAALAVLLIRRTPALALAPAPA
jgi:predicted MFS family arabinose efflux permease